MSKRSFSESVNVEIPRKIVFDYLSNCHAEERFKFAARSLFEDIPDVPEISTNDLQTEVSYRDRQQSWFGSAEIMISFLLVELSDSTTEVRITADYALPWLVTSFLTYPTGKMFEMQIRQSVLSSIEALLALETGAKATVAL